ncbi:diguanylate phosphodiesterase [Pseudorhodoferax sp. Leaf267]|nr:diguanylate phosphodiesterase [Pseudorhodoferax sp. Leaf267]
MSTRILVPSLALLLIVQAAVFLVVRGSIERNARAQIQHELQVGERVWRRLLEQNAQNLRQGAALLAADYAFRDAVGSGDLETIRSALDNHGARIGADLTALLDTRLQLRALGDTPDAAAISPVLQALAGTLSRSEQGAQIALVGHTPYQFVMVPMRAPLVIGWVVMGFPLTAGLADDMRQLSGVHVALITQGQGDAAAAQLGISTLKPTDLQALQAAGLDVSEFPVDGDTMVTHSVDLRASNGEVRTLLLRSLSEVKAPFAQIQAVLAIITGLGVLLFSLGSVVTAQRVTTPLRSLLQAAERLGRGQYEQRMQHTERRDEIGDLANAFDRMRQNIALSQNEIRQLAYWDRLTRLPNRTRFRDAVREAIADRQAGGSHAPLAVIVLNLDRFKHVNDVLGYAMGDRLLKAVAERLLERLEGIGGLLARMGGDQFAVLLPAADPASAMTTAQLLGESFVQPMSLEDQRVDLSAAAGIACWPTHADDADTLLSRAEVAMYAAKSRTTAVQLYDPAQDSTSTQTLSLLSELRHAVEHGELRLFLQPKIALADRRVVGAEALIRWLHPERGMVRPDHFIPFAEQTGFVRRLTLWMFEEVARQWAGLQPEDGLLRVSVNLSTRDLMDPELPAKLMELLTRHGVAPTGLCLEITESAIMDDPQRAELTLNRLAELGFKLSIDDFGTGYSSLAYLKRLPVDEMKIDKSFVMGMARDPDDAKIVRSTIDLAHNLGLSVVAEGVETADIWDQLRALRCDEAQGYHMGRPIPALEFAGWRAQWQQTAPLP